MRHIGKLRQVYKSEQAQDLSLIAVNKCESMMVKAMDEAETAFLVLICYYVRRDSSKKYELK